jgi:hypothetical protein
MLAGNVLLAAAISVLGLAPTAPAGPAVTLYRIEVAGNQVLWAQDKPRDNGTTLSFHRYPGGLLVSLRKADVRSVTPSKLPAGEAKAQRPSGQVILIGTTAPVAAAISPTGGTPSAEPLAPGERKDGTALLNPDRAYKPEWDSKQVPGMNIGFPNSPNDYREGKTYAYPPAPATQAAPGDVPKMPPGNGELPRGPG